jgi:hypothetical protein
LTFSQIAISSTHKNSVCRSKESKLSEGMRYKSSEGMKYKSSEGVKYKLSKEVNCKLSEGMKISVWWRGEIQVEGVSEI